MTKFQSDLSRLLTRLRNRGQRVASRSFARRSFTIDSHAPLISFSFDDFPRSALLNGGAILHSYGLSGTYYASLGLMGSQAPTGPIFVREDLKLLFEQGHELGCHTFTHCHAWDTPPKMFEDAVVQNRKALGELVPGAAFKTHSYPIGVPRPGTKRRASEYFACCRCGGQTFNIGNVDLNSLAAFFLEKSRDNPQVIKDLIDRNQRARGWLIFATHDVCSEPTPWGCTPDLFEAIVRYAVHSRSQILPVFEAFECLRNGSLPVPRTNEQQRVLL